MTSCASNQSTSAAPWTIKTTAVTKSSNDKPEAYQLGRYYQGQNRFDEAVNAYLKALNADANFAEAHNGLGVVYSRQGKYREAIEAFQAAIQQAPKAAHLYSNMGYAYYLQGQYAESVRALEQATKLDPHNQRALNNLGQAYAKAGSTTQSALAFSEAISVEKADHTVAETAVPAQSIPANVTNIAVASAQDANVQKVTVQDAQMLAIPKDSGVIRTANSAPAMVPVVESRARLVPVAPHVSELQLRPESAEMLQVASAEASQDLQKVRLEVANGNGVSGAASKVSKFLRGQGYAAARLTNQKPFKTKTTQIYYRAGYEAQAQLLQSKLLDAPKLIERNDMRASVSVRVVLGKDMVTQLAHYEYQAKIMQLALHAPQDTSTVKPLF
jgi:tetratricopeptide (TPR) repeat protein